MFRGNQRHIRTQHHNILVCGNFICLKCLKSNPSIKTHNKRRKEVSDECGQLVVTMIKLDLNNRNLFRAATDVTNGLVFFPSSSTSALVDSSSR